MSTDDRRRCRLGRTTVEREGSGLSAGAASSRIPESHRDLAECPPVAAPTTVRRTGVSQPAAVWCGLGSRLVRIHTMAGFAEERYLRRAPRVTPLCYVPSKPRRYPEIRGTFVEMTQGGAARHLDALASKYVGRP